MGASARAESRARSRIPARRALAATPAFDPAPERIRVMFAIGSLATGGSEKQLTQLALRLPRDRFEPVVAMSSSADIRTRFARELSDADVPIISAMRRRNSTRLGALRRYRRALRLIDPDVVYAWLDETAAVLAPLCRVHGIPCLVARRNIFGSELERRRPLFGFVARQTETAATLVTANSIAVADACARRGHHPDRIRLVSNGHERLGPLPVPPGPPIVFGYVAHFRREKGHHRLIDVLERVPRGGWRVDLAGDGPLRDEIAARIRRAGLTGYVRLVGAIDEVREFWSERHVAILLSDSEGSPNALLEAAVAGRPVIATAVGGTPEVVGPGGLLVDPDDLGAAAGAIQTLAGDARHRELLGRRIHSHVVRTYSLSRMLRGHIEALEEALAGDVARASARSMAMAGGTGVLT